MHRIFFDENLYRRKFPGLRYNYLSCMHIYTEISWVSSMYHAPADS